MVNSMLAKYDIEFIQSNHTSGTDDGIPWVAVPDRPGRIPYTLDEILEALRTESKAPKTTDSGPKSLREKGIQKR